ncbi:MAG TPA: hypothetical protein VNR67_05110 [Solirubrobacterales bacterium]|nr:hypothetical protein [Solirubrobacterales bacterium]
MSPIYSDDQPDRADKANRQSGDEEMAYAVPQKILIRMRDEDAILVRRPDMERYIKEVRELEGRSTSWVAAASTLVGVAVSLGVVAATVPGQLLTYLVLALFCTLGAFGCLIAHRQVNRQKRNAAEKIAREMEEAPVDEVVIRRMRPNDPLSPPPAPST